MAMVIERPLHRHLFHDPPTDAVRVMRSRRTRPSHWPKLTCTPPENRMGGASVTDSSEQQRPSGEGSKASRALAGHRFLFLFLNSLHVAFVDLFTVTLGRVAQGMVRVRRRLLLPSGSEGQHAPRSKAGRRMLRPTPPTPKSALVRRPVGRMARFRLRYGGVRTDLARRRRSDTRSNRGSKEHRRGDDVTRVSYPRPGLGGGARRNPLHMAVPRPQSGVLAHDMIDLLIAQEDESRAEAPLWTQKTGGRAATQDLDNRTAVRDKGSRRHPPPQPSSKGAAAPPIDEPSARSSRRQDLDNQPLPIKRPSRRSTCETGRAAAQDLDNRTAVRDKGSRRHSTPLRGRGPHKTLENHNNRTAVRDKGPSRRSGPRKPVITEPPFGIKDRGDTQLSLSTAAVKTITTEPPFGIKGRAAAQDLDNRTAATPLRKRFAIGSLACRVSYLPRRWTRQLLINIWSALDRPRRRWRCAAPCRPPRKAKDRGPFSINSELRDTPSLFISGFSSLAPVFLAILQLMHNGSPFHILLLYFFLFLPIYHYPPSSGAEAARALEALMWPHDQDSTLDESSVGILWRRYSIPAEYASRSAGSGLIRSQGLCSIADALEAVPLPLHPVIVSCISLWRISPSQVTPNSWRYLVAFLGECHYANITPTRNLFLSCFRLFKGVLVTRATNNKGWKRRFFFVQCEKDWGFGVRWSSATIDNTAQNSTPRSVAHLEKSR
ncbi:hypothetical protein MUK42_35474 [Musa troglodytarum]|uniref:Transposase (putative) gypsy type domain-containing protein n=1 Tax=Musa troglodytarum TaxID=320322 RepID=A0A9E7JBT4_9LILI|nr:hypothetical protein MUK42_35474 [Musa troglodytarum]